MLIGMLDFVKAPISINPSLTRSSTVLVLTGLWLKIIMSVKDIALFAELGEFYVVTII